MWLPNPKFTYYIGRFLSVIGGMLVGGVIGISFFLSFRVDDLIRGFLIPDGYSWRLAGVVAVGAILDVIGNRMVDKYIKENTLW